jgi:hypothetical protein
VLIWGAILVATWSFMQPARSRGLGTVLTRIRLDLELKAAAPDIPLQTVVQA